MFDLLANNQLLLLFTVIGLGYLIGNIKIFGFQLSVAAVLFVGIAFGAMDNRLVLPEHIYIVGLVLFVYAIGLQSGPGFFASFQKRGIRFSVATAAIILIGAIATFFIEKILGLSPASASGLFCGALTNTPALAAAVETAKNLSANLPASARDLNASSPVVTFGLAYPFGVFGVILCLFIASKVHKSKSPGDSPMPIGSQESEIILSRTFKITNPGIFGKTVADVLRPMGDPGFVLSRIKKGDKTDIVEPNTILESNDLIVAVGLSEAVQKAQIVFGELSPEHLAEGTDGIVYRRIFVSNKKLVGKPIKELQLHRQIHATITRIRRGDADFVASSDSVLELGDRIRVVAHKDKIEEASKFFGDSIKSIAETDFLSLSLGIVLGVFLGMIPIPLPHGLTFKLGFAGGPLIAGLILGRLERTGKISWGLPFNANLVLRQVGLVFFMAGIGIQAGHGFSATFNRGGLGLIAGGALITIVVTVSAILIGTRYFRLPMPAIMGMMAGIQTQPACLAYANQQTESELPNLWYATVYPASMVSKIILAQLIVSTLLMF
jgi:putative transport protein